MNQQQVIELLRNALAHAESVYRLNVVKDGEPSGGLENMQRVLAMNADVDPAPSEREAGALVVWNDALAEVRAEVSEMKNNLETFGEYSQETARCVLDGVLDAIDDLIAAPTPASEPAVDRDAVADTGLPELRQYLKHAGIAGESVTLSHSAAWALYSAMTYGASAPAVPAAPLVAPQGAQASPADPISCDLLLLKIREAGIISGIGAESLFYGEKIGFTLSDLLRILRATGTDASQGDV